MEMTLIVIAFLVVLALTAPFFGVDTRDGLDWRPIPPTPTPPEQRSSPTG